MVMGVMVRRIEILNVVTKGKSLCSEQGIGLLSLSSLGAKY